MEFKLPELGENIESGDVTAVSVKKGDTVSKDQTLLEIEAGKATMEVPSPVSGTVTAVHIKAGDTVDVGQLVMEIEEEGESPKSKVEGPKEEKKEKKESGDREQESEVREQPPSPKATASQGKSEDRGQESKEEESKPEARISKPESPQPSAVSAAPNIRKLARELGVDIHEVPVDKPEERISAEDVKLYARRLVLQQRQQNGGRVRPSLEHASAVPDFGRFGPVEREKMSQVRRAVMEHLAQAWNTIPHVTQHDMADITKLEELRKKYAPRAEAAGTKLTITAILVKIIAAALKVYPKFNSSIDPASEEIIYKKYYNIGVAVDTDRGLLVPVIPNADTKNILQIAADIQEVASKARSGKTGAADLEGGTFTVTNLGGIGGSFFTPIINSPEVAILGVGRAIMDPCIGNKDGLCAPRLRLPLSLSYDHRLIDGADGARFLKWVVDAVEEPMLISLEG